MSLAFELLISIIGLILSFMYLGVIYEYRRKARILTDKEISFSDDLMSEDLNDFMHEYEQAPGPFPWPILGNLHLLGQAKSPFISLTQLAAKFGDAYSLTLGTTRCLVVNNLDLIREVLNKNGKYFGGRPNFLRYHVLFGGDRCNSLALCDWSQLQQRRRNLARRHCSPRDTSALFTKMSDVGCFESQAFMYKLKQKLTPGEEYNIKPIIREACANMFLQYMTSCRFDYDDMEFQKIVEYFDEIFWEINQGYAVDFLPWLAPFYKKHFNQITLWSTTIRKFIEERVIKGREQRNYDDDEPDMDFTDALFRSLKEDCNVSRDTIIYMLEDFVGGHSAVANLVMLALTYIAMNPMVGVNIQNEIDELYKMKGESAGISLMDMDAMPYTMATIYEVLRYSSSPIVPHVATEDTVIAGYGVIKGTIVFINNYELNTSKKYWDKPDEFNPEKFLENDTILSKRRHSESYDSGVEIETTKELTKCKIASATTKTATTTTTAAETLAKKRKVLKKNIPHFLPFSIGRRTCIGQSLVRGFGFVLLANIMNFYNVSCKDFSNIKINPACVALPAKTHSLVFNPRTIA